MELRAFLESLSQHGMLHRVSTEVDVLLEAGAIARECRQPVLFEKLKGYPDFRLFANGLSGPGAFALSLGMPVDCTLRQIGRELARRRATPLQPELVKDATAWQNVQAGEIDLTVLPVPQWHPQDRGPYLGTWHINVSRIRRAEPGT